MKPVETFDITVYEPDLGPDGHTYTKRVEAGSKEEAEWLAVHLAQIEHPDSKGFDILETAPIGDLVVGPYGT